MDSSEDRRADLNGYILSLPTELLVIILSFLRDVRDKVKLQYVSRRFRSVSRETPSLWREFIWPNLDNHEEGCVKSVLKSCGRYIVQLSFPDHVVPSKLTALLLHCSNLVQLSIPTSQLSPDQLMKVMKSAEKLQGLDIQWTNQIYPLLEICGRLKELTVRTVTRLTLDSEDSSFREGLDSWMDKWVKNGFHPQTINVSAAQSSSLIDLVQCWYLFNPSSPPDTTGCLKVYNSLRAPMDMFPVLPDFQLYFGPSCILPFVDPSKYGLLGLKEEDMFLTDCVCHGETLLKAVMLKLYDDIELNHFKSDVTSLSCVIQFDATHCNLYPGHLEQLAVACPNLQHLNLLGNSHCLKRLQGLHAIFTSCKNIRGLNLVEVSRVEDYVQLWKILVDMKLSYLGIDLSMLIPRIDEVTEVISLFQQCINLKAIEVQRARRFGHFGYDLSVLSDFPSLVHCHIVNVPREIDAVINNCSKLKYFVHSSYSSKFSDLSVVENDSLEQLCIKSIGPSNVVVPDTFLESVSVHGGLVHVALRVGALFTDGITALIENSPSLLTCHIYTDKIIDSANDEDTTLTDMKLNLEKKYSNRKLFTCGSFQLLGTKAGTYFVAMENLLIERHTDILSLWSNSWEALSGILRNQMM